KTISWHKAVIYSLMWNYLKNGDGVIMLRPFKVLLKKVSICIGTALLAVSNVAPSWAEGTVNLERLSCVDVVVSGTSNKPFVDVTVNNIGFYYVYVPDSDIRIGATGPVPVEADGTFRMTVKYVVPVKHIYFAIRVWDEDSDSRNRSLIGSFDR